jgi:asparagine synthase (glutamine-hydrolysing)
MRDSVAVHLRSDAPLGAFLSGGIDSATICALAAEHRPDLLTFTVGFEREGYNEIDRAQETAAAIGVKSVPYVISQEEFFRYLPQIIWHLDDPMANESAVPVWFVAREASKQVKVVLSGEGSDELFGGYTAYHQPGVVRAGEHLPGWIRVSLQRATALIPPGVKGKGLLECTSTPLRRRYIGNPGYGALITGPGRPDPARAYDVTDPVYDQAEAAELDDVSTMQLVDINTWLPGDILVQADRMTMAHSLELRVPFLDREVMAVAGRLAREEKIGAGRGLGGLHPGTTKRALRTAMSEVLPKAAAERPKMAFPVPIGHWLKGDAYGFADRLLREAQTDQWVNREAALDLLQAFRAGDPAVSWRHPWVLIVFSLWHQIYVERAYDPIALGWEKAPRADPAGEGRRLFGRSSGEPVARRVGEVHWPEFTVGELRGSRAPASRTPPAPAMPAGRCPVRDPASPLPRTRHLRGERQSHGCGRVLPVACFADWGAACRLMRQLAVMLPA